MVFKGCARCNGDLYIEEGWGLGPRSHNQVVPHNEAAELADRCTAACHISAAHWTRAAECLHRPALSL